MWKAEIRIGEDYAVREKRQPGVPFQRVRIVAHVRHNKWKVQWIDPNPGLVDYIESRCLVVPWKDRKAFLADEERECRLRKHNERLGGRDESPVTTALTSVFEAAADGLTFHRGVLTGDPEAVARVRERARATEMKQSPYSYVDRHGEAHIAFDEALELGKAFCAAEPSTVLVGIEATELKWRHEAGQPGRDYMVSLLNEYQAAWALIRQWAGHDAAIAQREAQIQRLERLVLDAIYALQKAGLEGEACRLRRALSG